MHSFPIQQVFYQEYSVRECSSSIGIMSFGDGPALNIIDIHEECAMRYVYLEECYGLASDSMEVWLLYGQEVAEILHIGFLMEAKSKRQPAHRVYGGEAILTVSSNIGM